MSFSPIISALATYLSIKLHPISTDSLCSPICLVICYRRLYIYIGKRLRVQEKEYKAYSNLKRSKIKTTTKRNKHAGTKSPPKFNQPKHHRLTGKKPKPLKASDTSGTPPPMRATREEQTARTTHICLMIIYFSFLFQKFILVSHL